MFCPHCGYEYVEGVTECADCGAKLQPHPPRTARRTPKEFVEILSTYNQGDIALIKSILDNDRVEYFFAGENFSQIGQLIQPATLLVRKDHADRAREALKNMKVTFLGVTG